MSFIQRSMCKKYALYFLLCFIGLIFSSYSINHYYKVKLVTGQSSVCNINQTFNCDAVANSAYSSLFGAPLGVYGASYFLIMIVLLSIGISTSKSARSHFLTYSYVNMLGVLVSLALAVISSIVLHVYCLACIGIYLVCLLQTSLLIWQRQRFAFKLNFKDLFQGATTAALILVLIISLHAYSKPTPKQAETLLQDPATSALTAKIHEIPISKSRYTAEGEDYRHGSEQAKAQIVEFIDFQCPACKRVGKVLKQLQTELGDKILLVVKNFPVDKNCNKSVQMEAHKHACNIAVMARCAGEYGKFWQYHDLAFAQQSVNKKENADNWARQVGLTDAQIDSCKNASWLLEKVKADIDLALGLGVEGTPTIFINGKRYVGAYEINALRTAVEKQLAD